MGNVRKSILLVMVITVLSRLTGFIRELALAMVYGTTFYTDAYSISSGIPFVIFSSIGIALETIFIPIYLSTKETQDETRAKDFTNNILNIVLIVSSILVILSYIFVKPLVNIFAIGFDGKVLDITISFTKILLPGILFIGMNYIFSGYLQSNSKFGIPTFINIPGNIVIIISIYLSYIWNINALLYATLFAIFLQAAIQGWYAFRAGFRYKFSIEFKDKNIIKMLKMIIPVFIGTAAQQINILIDKTLASTLGEGSVSSLDFADKLNSFVYSVFATSITTVVYPMFSKISAEENMELFKEYLKKSINIIIILMVPISIGAMCLSTPIVKTIYERGNFNSSATALTSGALFYFSIGIIGLSLRNLLVRVFYSLHDMKTPVFNGMIATIINIILSIMLVRYMGNKGIALATSISSLLASGILFYKLRSKIGFIGEKGIVKLSLKVFASSAIMAAGVLFFYQYTSVFIGGTQILELVRLLLSIIFGGAIYLGLLKLMNVKELNLAAHFVRLKNYFKIHK